VVVEGSVSTRKINTHTAWSGAITNGLPAATRLGRELRARWVEALHIEIRARDVALGEDGEFARRAAVREVVCEKISSRTLVPGVDGTGAVSERVPAGVADKLVVDGREVARLAGGDPLSVVEHVDVGDIDEGSRRVVDKTAPAEVREVDRPSVLSTSRAPGGASIPATVNVASGPSPVVSMSNASGVRSPITDGGGR
jgi:hypothetical protein